MLHDSIAADIRCAVRAFRGDADGGALAVPELDDLLALPVLEDAAMYTDQGMYNASGFGTPEELQATVTTHNFPSHSDLFRSAGIAPDPRSYRQRDC